MDSKDRKNLIAIQEENYINVYCACEFPFIGNLSEHLFFKEKNVTVLYLWPDIIIYVPYATCSIAI